MIWNIVHLKKNFVMDMNDKLLMNNAFLFLANADRILADKRMYMASTGKLCAEGKLGCTVGKVDNVRLGELVELWLSGEGVGVCNEERLLMLNFSGIVYYANCYYANEKGDMIVGNGQYKGLYEIRKRNGECVDCEDAYSIEEVVAILKNEGKKYNADEYDSLFKKANFEITKDYKRTEECAEQSSILKGISMLDERGAKERVVELRKEICDARLALIEARTKKKCLEAKEAVKERMEKIDALTAKMKTMNAELKVLLDGTGLEKVADSRNLLKTYPPRLEKNFDVYLEIGS